MTDFIEQVSTALDELLPDEPRPELHFSSIGNCAAQQMYRIRGVPHTDPREGWRRWAPEMGRRGQDLAASVARQMGYTVENVDAVAEWHGIIGKIDGEISAFPAEHPHWRMGVEAHLFEVKCRSLYGYLEMVESATEAVRTNPRRFLVKFDSKGRQQDADPQTALQIQGYMAARGLSACDLWIIAFDSGAAGYTIRQRSLPMHPGFTRVRVPVFETQRNLVARRAEQLTVALENNLRVVREYDPVRTNFPCNYCDYKSLCIADGEGGDLAVANWR